MLYLQKYFTSFHKHFFSWKKTKMAIVVENSSAQIFWFCNSNVTTFETSRKCKNFNFSLHTVAAEMLYLQKYLTNFRKLFLAERRGRWHRYFDVAIATLQLFQHSENVKISIFPLHCPSRNTISPQVFNEFTKTFFAERRGKWVFWFKISSAQVFGFCNCNVKTFPTSRKCKNFNFFLHTVLAKMLYLQKYLTNSQNFFCLKEEKGGYCGWKLQGHRYFDFAIATLQLFQNPGNVKISIFPFKLSQQKCYISRSIQRIF